MGEPGSLEIPYPREADCGRIGSAEPLSPWRRPTSTSLLWNLWMFELPGDVEGGMSVGNGKKKPGTARGSPRRSRTAKAVHINRRAMKLCCAREWGWGRLSVECFCFIKDWVEKKVRRHMMRTPLPGPWRGCRGALPRAAALVGGLFIREALDAINGDVFCSGRHGSLPR
jgi:hypothetical protein